MTRRPPHSLLTALAAVVLLTPHVGAANGDAEAEPAPPAARDDCAGSTAARIQAFYESVRDVDADFEQSTQSVALGTGSAAAASRSSGHVTFAKPGRMRWSYRQPQPSLVVSDGTTLWLYDPAAREAQRLTVTAGYLSGAALSFLLGEGDLEGEFRIEARRCDEGEVELELTPRGEASYERLGLVVDPATGEVRQTRVVDLFGNVTEVRFRGSRVNTSPPASTFQFDPPADATVIDLAP